MNNYVQKGGNITLKRLIALKKWLLLIVLGYGGSLVLLLLFCYQVRIKAGMPMVTLEKYRPLFERNMEREWFE